jgi:2,3-bisphosphoglycerate-independent phosphoglycerate mutase
MNKKVLLVILDGWGLGTNPEVSAIYKAKTPFMDQAWDTFPHSRLNASGLAVGLPAGQMGNSEVGHMNIGAGRVVYQDLVKINMVIEDGSLAKNPTLTSALEHAKKSGNKLHFIGLVSDGGVHSHIDHLKALCEIAQRKGLSDRIKVHAFTDGRDTDPNSGIKFLTDLQRFLNSKGGQLASVVGRYYAMDRDNRWSRVQKAYDALVHGKGYYSKNIIEAVGRSYEAGITDEFLEPIIAINEESEPVGLIEEGDTVICFNFRTDRGRQITQALTQKDFPEFGMNRLNLCYVTLTSYDRRFQNIKVIFEKDNLENTLGEVLSKHGLKQIRIAETEKYPHVTFFFSGGREEPFDGESRIMCPSPKVATYDLQPGMSAEAIKNSILPELAAQSADFICLNFANADMVGHTGVFQAAVKACEVVDQCTEEVVKAALDNEYTVIIIADHGNSDYMINPDGSPNTAHTTNLVPCILIDNNYHRPISDGKLGDLAPTILNLMGLPVPAEMSGDNLL